MTTWKKELAKSGAWVLSISHTIKILAFLSTFVLARLLSPSDFGIVAMATAVVALVEMLGDFGFHVYLVQKKDLGKQDLDTAWTFQVLLGLAQSLILVGSGPYVGQFYGEPRLSEVFYVLGAAVFVGGFRNIGIVSFQKELKFHLEFFLRIPSKAIGVVLGVILAYTMRNYWALVIGISSQRITEVVASYLLCRYRPRFSVQGAGDLFRFSKWLYINTTLSFLLQRSPDLVLGKLAGQYAVGLFSVSHSIATLPTSEFVDPIARATFPSYVKLRHDLAVLRNGYLNVLSLIAFFSIPMGVGIAVLAESLVPALLGQKWASAVPLLQVLAFGGILKTLQSNAGSVFLAQGRPWTVTGLWAMKTCVLVPILIVFSMHSKALGASWAFLLAEAFVGPLFLHYVFRSLNISWRTGLQILARPCIAALFMYAAIVIINASRLFGPASARGLFSLFMLISIGAIVYLSTALSLWALMGKNTSAPESWLVGGVRSFFMGGVKVARN